MPLRYELSAEEMSLVLARARESAGLPIDDGTPAGRAAAAAHAASHTSAGSSEQTLAKGIARARAVEAAASSSAFASDPAFDSLKDVELPAGFDDSDDGEEAGGASEDDDEGGGGMLMSYSSTMYTDQRADPHFVEGARGDGMFEDEDEDDEDDADALEAKAGDSFFVAARTDDDWSCAEVYVYVREEGSLFVHHDIALPAMPLALAWMDCPPAKSPEEAAVSASDCGVGSYLAVGSMRPGIEIWNLDVTDPLEPVMVLGGTSAEQLPHQLALSGSSKGELATGSHTDAVVALAWNRTHRQLLASGSADTTVKLWDVRRGVALNTWKHHTAHVQSIDWHPFSGSESSILACSSADSTATVLDARTATGAVMRLGLGAPGESVAWHVHNSAVMFATAESGHLLAFDVRSPSKSIWRHAVASGECAGLSVSPRLPGIVATGGGDGIVKVWDVTGGSAGGTVAGSPPRLVASKAMAVGPLFTTSWLPHADAVIAAAGGKGVVALWDIPGDDSRVGGELKGRAVAPSTVPSLAVRHREDGQPVSTEGGSAGPVAASTSVIRSDEAPRSTSSSSEAKAHIAAARRRGAEMESMAGRVAQGKDLSAIMEEALANAGPRGGGVSTSRGGKKKKTKNGKKR
jgi:periodic tryptophan protein 1